MTRRRISISTWSNLPSRKLDNLTVFPRQTEVHTFYHSASIVLNLTNPKFAVETFGLTVLEAMSAGKPVIAPTQGGVAELVKDGENGYKVDVQKLDVIEMHIINILANRTLYLELAEAATETSKRYSAINMFSEIRKIL